MTLRNTKKKSNTHTNTAAVMNWIHPTFHSCNYTVDVALKKKSETILAFVGVVQVNAKTIPRMQIRSEGHFDIIYFGAVSNAIPFSNQNDVVDPSGPCFVLAFVWSVWFCHTHTQNGNCMEISIFH